MPDDFENDPHFIDVEADLGGEGMGVLTRDALNLLMHGVSTAVPTEARGSSVMTG